AVVVDAVARLGHRLLVAHTGAVVGPPVARLHLRAARPARRHDRRPVARLGPSAVVRQLVEDDRRAERVAARRMAAPAGARPTADVVEPVAVEIGETDGLVVMRRRPAARVRPLRAVDARELAAGPVPAEHLRVGPYAAIVGAGAIDVSGAQGRVVRAVGPAARVRQAGDGHLGLERGPGAARALERVAVASAEIAAAVTVEVEEPDGAPEAHRAPVAAVPGGPVDLGREAVAVRQPAHHARV